MNSRFQIISELLLEQINSRNWENTNKAKMIWSNDFSEHNICNIIEQNINAKV